EKMAQNAPINTLIFSKKLRSFGNNRGLQWHFCHCKVMILQLMNIQGMVKMPVVLPVPYIQVGIIAWIMNNHPEWAFFIFCSVTSFFFFKTQGMYQLMFCQRHGNNILRGKPKLLDTIVYTNHIVFTGNVSYHSNPFNSCVHNMN